MIPWVVAGPLCPRGADCRREKCRHPQCLGPAFFHIPASRLTGLRALPGTCECASRPPPQPTALLLFIAHGGGGVEAASCPVSEESSRACSSVLSLAGRRSPVQVACAGRGHWSSGGREGGPSWGPWGAGIGGEDRLGWTHLGPLPATKAARAVAQSGHGLLQAQASPPRAERAPLAPQLQLPGETFNSVLVNK